MHRLYRKTSKNKRGKSTKLRNQKRRSFRRNKTKVVRGGGEVPNGYIEIKGFGVGDLRMNLNIDKFNDTAQIMLVSKDNDGKLETTIGLLKIEHPTDYKKQLSILQPYYHIYVKNTDK